MSPVSRAMSVGSPPVPSGATAPSICRPLDEQRLHCLPLHGRRMLRGIAEVIRHADVKRLDGCDFHGFSSTSKAALARLPVIPRPPFALHMPPAVPHPT